jgi:hypothetical protein
MRNARLLIALAALGMMPTLGATAPDAAEHCIHKFLAQDDAQPQYRATRRLEAENEGRSGWLEAVTEYSPATGFRYRVTAEGGSGLIRGKVLRAVLDGERDAIAGGETSRSSLDRNNYTFQPNGVDEDGLAIVRLTPRRKDRVLVAGDMFLNPAEGNLVRLQGRLAKSPSFWVRDVDIVRTYQRFGDAVLPVALESKAELRLFGSATLHMTYDYSEIDGRPVTASH